MPLVHFLSHGVDEGRFRLPSVERLRRETNGSTVRDAARVRLPGHGDVTIVIAVYADLDLSINCIKSVLNARNDTAFQIQVIYDAGPDPQLELNCAS